MKRRYPSYIVEEESYITKTLVGQVECFDIFKDDQDPTWYMISGPVSGWWIKLDDNKNLGKFIFDEAAQTFGTAEQRIKCVEFARAYSNLRS